MKYMLLFLCLALSLIGCGEKKPTAQDLADQEQQYNFRAAVQAYKIGINALNHKEFQKAIDSLLKAIAMDDTNYRFRYGLGLAYSMHGQLEKALVQLEEGLRINPNDTESYNLMGTIYIDLGRYEEATQALRKVIQDKTFSEPKFPYFNLGLCLRKQKQTDKAIAAFQLATQYDPEFYRAYVALGEIYNEQKNFPQMLYYYLKAEPAFSNDVNVLFHIGYAAFKLKKYDQAKRYLAQVSILFPTPTIDRSTQTMLNYINRMQQH